MGANAPLPGDDWLAREFKQAIKDWKELPPQARPVYVPPAPEIPGPVSAVSYGVDPDERSSAHGVDYCEQCDTDTHVCPGCGAPIIHGMYACIECADL